MSVTDYGTGGVSFERNREVPIAHRENVKKPRRREFQPDPNRDRLEDAASRAKLARNKMRALADTFPSVWKTSIETRELPAEVLIEISGAQQDVLSALDYVAHELRERGGPGSGGDLYFPAAEPGETVGRFREKLDQMFPHLRQSEPQAIEEVVALQRFGERDFGWLSVLKDMNNPAKHEGLPHTHVMRIKGTLSAPGYETKDFETFALNAGSLGDPRAFTEKAAEKVLDFIRRLQRTLPQAPAAPRSSLIGPVHTLPVQAVPPLPSASHGLTASCMMCGASWTQEQGGTSRNCPACGETDWSVERPLEQYVGARNRYQIVGEESSHHRVLLLHLQGVGFGSRTLVYLSHRLKLVYQEQKAVMGVSDGRGLVIVFDRPSHGPEKGRWIIESLSRGSP